MSSPRRCFVSWLLRGLDEGFPIGFDPARCNLRSVAHNHPSSLCNKVAAQYIAHEVSLGRLVSPVTSEGIHTSPIGLIPKAQQPGRWRMIVDLSCPPGSSVNDGIDPSLSSIHYASVDNAVEIIRSLGPTGHKQNGGPFYLLGVPGYLVGHCSVGITIA